MKYMRIFKLNDAVKLEAYNAKDADYFCFKFTRADPGHVHIVPKAKPDNAVFWL